MAIDSLREEVLKLHPEFSTDALEWGLSLFERKTCGSYDSVLEPDTSCNYLFFSEDSVARCFYYDDAGAEKTVWMEPERMFVTDFESFIKGTPSRTYLQFYQDTVVFMIHRDKLNKLYLESKDWAVFGIKLMESYHVRILELFTIMFNNDATKNYRFIEEHFKDFLKVAPLKDIASMLNLSPVSLSRIRAGKQKKATS